MLRSAKFFYLQKMRVLFSVTNLKENVKNKKIIKRPNLFLCMNNLFFLKKKIRSFKTVKRKQNLFSQ